MPIMRFHPGLSPKKSHAPIPTKIGWVVTKTTELATEVYFSEAIQKAKWRPSRIPEKATQRISPLLHGFQIRPWQAKGTRIRDARTILYAAMTNAGASASLIKMEAVEIAKIPAKRRKATIGFRVKNGSNPALERQKGAIKRWTLNFSQHPPSETAHQPLIDRPLQQYVQHLSIGIPIAFTMSPSR